jgi:hypothetical protein
MLGFGRPGFVQQQGNRRGRHTWWGARRRRRTLQEDLALPESRYFVRAKQVMKYGFTLTKIMCEGTPSRITSHGNRLTKYTFS